MVVQGPEIHLDLAAYAKNLRLLQELSGGKKIMPVVKANAYGHGAKILSKFLEREFDSSQMPRCCVARMNEAEELREAGVLREILVLSQFSKEEIVKSKFLNFSYYLSCVEDVEAILKLDDISIRKISSVFIHLNTGMSRLGFKAENIISSMGNVFALLKKLKDRGIVVQGFSSHYARAEESPDLGSKRQAELFRDAIKALENEWNKYFSDKFPKELHLSNSAGCCLGIFNEETAVRPGILSYGLFQDETSQKYLCDNYPELKKLTPVLSLSSPLKNIHTLLPGEGISYGHRFVASEEMQIGVVSLGYADGIRRVLGRSNNDTSLLNFWVEGRACPIVGTVTMDMVMIDLTNHPSLEELKQRSSSGKCIEAKWICMEQPAEKHAEILKTISYEIVCDLSSRVRRCVLGETVS